MVVKGLNNLNVSKMMHTTHIVLVWESSSLKLEKRLPAQLRPSPVKPLLHEQIKEPSVLLHPALESQTLVPGKLHSSISTNLKKFVFGQ